jgi:hypothetical protein
LRLILNVITVSRLFMRLSNRFLLLCLLLSLLVVTTLIDAGYVGEDDTRRRSHIRTLVKSLSLTDPALFTEARYTRHLSQSDRHAPFQDHPMAFEHFPSGSLVTPPSPEDRP